MPLAEGQYMRKLLWGLALAFFFIEIIPVLIFGFSYIPGVISIRDMIDIFVYPPIMGYLFYMIYNEVFREYNGLVSPLYFLAVVLHFEGHGFHWAANALNVMMEHAGISGVVLKYAFLLDEIISHKMMFHAFIVILLIILYMATKYRIGESENALKYMFPAGILFGFSLSAAMVEGQSPYELIITCIIILLIITLTPYGGFSRVKRNDVLAFLFSMALFSLVLAGAYYAIFKGFPQPSEILG